jgi:SanA protein
MTRRRKGCFTFLIILMAIGLFPFVWRSAVTWFYERHIYAVSEAPEEQVAIVYGAAVYRNGRLSGVLRDRMETAITLYENGQVQKIIVSGDNQDPDYNEPGAMMAYAVQRGVPPADIQPDYAGLRTYDTCYRAKYIFQVESAVLITQDFHLPRALFTCNALGIEAIGVTADRQPYRGARWYETRETAATLVALWDVITRQKPAILGDPIPIQLEY